MGSNLGGGGGRSMPQMTTLDIPQILSAGQGAANQMSGDTLQRTRELAVEIGKSSYAKGAWQMAQEAAQRSRRLAEIAEATRASSGQAADRVQGYADPTDRASLAAQQAVDAAAGRVEGSAGALGSLAGRINFDPTAIEAELERQAISELGFGRLLSPEEMRDAQQSARAAFAARGLANSLGSSAAEILNRDRMATARQDQRRQFASGVNAANQQTRLARLGLGGQLYGQQGSLFANAGQLRGDAGRLRLAGLGQAANISDAAGRLRLAGDTAAGGMVESSGNLALNTASNINAQNPYNLAMGAMPTLGGLTQAGYGLSSDAYTFNANAQNWRNYNAYANSGGGSGLGGMLGMGVGAGLGALGVALAPATFGTSLLPAMAAGAGIGGGLGGMLGSSR